MDTREIAQDFQARNGWTDTEMLDAALTYIANQDSNDTFADFLSEQVDQP
jgi:hypothetical protein